MVDAQQRYRITERIDAGGMAEVFRGVAESMQGFKRAVAIKRILSSLAKNKKFVSMFLDEARLSLQLQHTNIVQVFDIGVAESYFIVMELVDGSNLKTLIDVHKKLNRRIKASHALFIVMEVCKGLQYAHNLKDIETGRPLGIVHRDISPPNILLSREGEVKLVDFGLAKAASQIESTEPGVVKGKFSYLAPEAVEGQVVDHRADVFATGILLWELLSGKRLFYGETDYQTVELVRQAKVPPLAAINPEIEPELDGIVRKALARTPETRYQQAADLGDAVAQYLFSRGMKVTSRDIARLVQEMLAEKKRLQEPAQKSGSLIDALIQEEILKFTSLDAGEETGGGGDLASGSPSQNALGSTSAASPAAPAGDDSFIDPRAWAGDDDAPATPAPQKSAGTQAGGTQAGPLGGEAAPCKMQEIPSLATKLEPEAAAPARAPQAVPEQAEAPRAAPAQPTGRGTMVAMLLVVLMLLAGAGITFAAFHDRLTSMFKGPAPVTPAAKMK